MERRTVPATPSGFVAVWQTARPFVPSSRTRHRTVSSVHHRHCSPERPRRFRDHPCRYDTRLDQRDGDTPRGELQTKRIREAPQTELCYIVGTDDGKRQPPVHRADIDDAPPCLRISGRAVALSIPDDAPVTKMDIFVPRLMSRSCTGRPAPYPTARNEGCRDRRRSRGVMSREHPGENTYRRRRSL